MTPQEKAEQMHHNIYEELPDHYDDWNIATRIALITINEMLDYRNGLYVNEGSLVHQYLLDVKRNLESF